jgi:hypothetical protein
VAIDWGSEPVTPQAAGLGHQPGGGEKALGMPWGVNLRHPPLALAGRLGGMLGAVVQIPVLPMLDTGPHLALGGAVALQLVRDDAPRYRRQPRKELAEKLLGSRLITPPLDQDIEAVPTLIDGPPETMAGRVDRATPLLQIPFVPRSGRWRRHALADACLNCRPQERPASYVRLMPRSTISASTSRSRRPKRKYSQTQWLRQIRRAQVG